MSQPINLPTLFKKTAAGKIQSWKIWVEDDNGVGVIHIQYGLVDGKQQHKTDAVTKGKNQGKKNETTPLQQAVAEAQAKWTKQLEREHYSEDPTGEESAALRGEAPMLAHKFEDHAKKIEWDSAYGQPKLDGFRCTAKKVDGVVQLSTRKGEAIKTLPHLVEVLTSKLVDDQTIDGELYLHGEELRNIGSYIRRQQPGSEKIEYHVYDTMFPTDFAERHELLQRHLGGLTSDKIVLVRTSQIPDYDTLMAFQADCIDGGFEGAMLRQGKKPYEAGKRSDSLLKVKNFIDAEFPVVGAKEGRGSYAGCAIFECQTPAGHRFEVTAPGDMARKRAYWRNSERYIGKMLTVKFAYWTTTTEPKPFHPVAKAFRD